jgi:hypothetical protein
MNNKLKPPNELLEGVNKFLSKNRDSLTIEEISLLTEVSKHFEEISEYEHTLSRSEIINLCVKIIARLFEFFSDSNSFSELMKLF